jgi:hypothetical protein
MPLNATALGTQICSDLGITDTNAAAKMHLLATTIVNYITANAVVSVTVNTTAPVVSSILSAGPGGACTGGPLPASGTGTGTIA